MTNFEEIKLTTPYGKEDNVLKITIDNEENGYRLPDLISESGNYFFVIWYKSDTNCTITFDIFGNTEQINSTSEWKKYSKKVSVKDLTNKKIDIIPQTNSVTYFYEAFLTKGTTDTSWTPNPDDIADNFEQVNSKIEQTATDIILGVEKNYISKTELGETVKTIKSEIKLTADTINQTVTGLGGNLSNVEQKVGTIESTVKTVQGDISKVTQTANEVLNEVKNARGDKASLKLKIDSIATEVSNNKGEISRVEQKADTISQRVENVNTNLSSQITQTSNEIRQEVANADKGLASQITQTAETINQRITNEKQGLESQIAQSSQDVLIQVSNKHYDKATVDSMLKVESDKITSTVTSKINVGSRNLLLKSDTVYTNSLYEMATYQMVEKMKAGTKYTCTIWGNLASGKTDFSISLNGSTQLGKLTKESDGLYSLTFDGIQDNSESSLLYVYANPSYSQYTSTINKIKLSYGNVRTDWTPAVEEKLSTEDFNEIINGDNGIIDQIENSKSEITQLSNSISTLVKDENGSSLMTQTPDGWEFNIGGINKKLSDASKDIANNKTAIENTDKYVDIIQKQQEAIENKTAVINFTTLNGQPAILLGQTNNSFKLRITNTSIDFLDGSTVVAYISNKVLYIEKAIVKNEIQIGEGAGFVFKRRSNGNMGIRFAKGVIV